MSTHEQVLAAENELLAHNDAAVEQRRAISKFTREYAKSLNVNADLPNEIIPDHIDDEIEETVDDVDDAAGASSSLVNGEVLLLAGDFGQGIALPHYGLIRPSVDYFQSNLMLNLYVMSDISRNEQNVFVYDERLMGKDKDALCSLRMAFHIKSRNKCLALGVVPPKVFISIRDNCVGQNKSNVTLKLECFLSMSFYERVLIIYLIPGHSHMLPDRVVSWVKKFLAQRNLYSPQCIVAGENEF
eukprot:gene18208-25613_t